MKNFNELCAIAEELSPEEYTAVLIAKTKQILPALHKVTDDGIETLKLYAAFLISSVCADGKIDETEYLLLLPTLKAVFGPDFDYADAKRLARELRPETRQFKAAMNRILDEIGEVDEDLKDDLVIVSLLICAIDGKITAKEKRYIKQLIA